MRYAGRRFVSGQAVDIFCRSVTLCSAKSALKIGSTARKQPTTEKEAGGMRRKLHSHPGAVKREAVINLNSSGRLNMSAASWKR